MFVQEKVVELEQHLIPPCPLPSQVMFVPLSMTMAYEGKLISHSTTVNETLQMTAQNLFSALLSCWQPPRGGGGGTPLYKLYRYVPPQRVWFSSRFGLKTGIDFDHYGLKSGMVFKGTTGAYKRICLTTPNE